MVNYCIYKSIKILSQVFNLEMQNSEKIKKGEVDEFYDANDSDVPEGMSHALSGVFLLENGRQLYVPMTQVLNPIFNYFKINRSILCSLKMVLRSNKKFYPD